MALPPINVLSLFSGGGGLDLGLHLATRGRARAVVYVEREAYAAACLVARMEEQALAPAPVWDDVSTFDGRPWRGIVDIVAGGSPCQDLSFAGKRAGLDGARSGLFFDFVRVAREVEAPLVFWENVGGARASLSRVAEAFEAEGYTGAVVQVRAADVGATHRRARLFLLAYRHRLGLEALGLDHGEPEASLGHDLVQRNHLVGDALSLDVQLPGEPTKLQCQKRSLAGEGLAPAGRQSRPTGRPLEFPPGPDDEAGWSRVLSVRPDLAPAQPHVRGVAHGLAGGVGNTWRDSLRLLGNGVVPQQAAAAFCFLTRALAQRLDTPGPAIY